MNMNRRFKAILVYLLILSFVSITVLVIENINGLEGFLPKIVMDINAGVVGAILTTIITLLLLSNQNDLQETQLKKSVIYEEKLKLFNNFLTILNESVKDGSLSPVEMQNIIFRYSLVRMHISERSAYVIEKSIREIDESLFYVNENGVPRFDSFIKLYTNICNELRKELYINEYINDDEYSKDLPEFTFPNFSGIAYRKRHVYLAVNSIEEAIGVYKLNRNIFHENKVIKYQFTLEEGNLITLQIAYRMIRELMDEFDGSGIQERYSMPSYEINEGRYLGLFNLIFIRNGREFAKLGVTEKNRVIYKRLLPTLTQFPFEKDTDVNGYREKIRSDLRLYFSSQATQ